MAAKAKFLGPGEYGRKAETKGIDRRAPAYTHVAMLYVWQHYNNNIVGYVAICLYISYGIQNLYRVITTCLLSISIYGYTIWLL